MAHIQAVVPVLNEKTIIPALVEKKAKDMLASESQVFLPRATKRVAKAS